MMVPHRAPDARVKLASTGSETGRMHSWLDQVAAGLPERTAFALRLCLEEAIMNVAMHGYGEDTPGPVDVSLWITDDPVRALIADRAPPFDPTQPALAVPAHTLSDTRLGGRGLLLMHKFAASLSYQRADGQNRLMMAFPR